MCQASAKPAAFMLLVTGAQMSSAGASILGPWVSSGCVQGTADKNGAHASLWED